MLASRFFDIGCWLLDTGYSVLESFRVGRLNLNKMKPSITQRQIERDELRVTSTEYREASTEYREPSNEIRLQI